MAQYAIRWSLRVCLAGIFNVHAKSEILGPFRKENYYQLLLLFFERENI